MVTTRDQWQMDGREEEWGQKSDIRVEEKEEIKDKGQKGGEESDK